jgi:hypothetical protein
MAFDEWGNIYRALAIVNDLQSIGSGQIAD